MSLLAAATIALPHVNYTTILPELILLGGMLVILAASALFTRTIPTEAYATATAGLGIASLIASLVLYHDVRAHGGFLAIAGSIDVDGFSVLILVLSSSIVIIAAMAAAAFLRQEQMAGPEYYALALIAASGAMIMGSANDLILIFLGLEILSIPLYVMAGFDRRREASGEAAMKYFVLGAFSSAIFVYGIALMYGATGSTNLASIGAYLAKNVIVSNGVLLAGLVLLLVGFAFKIAAVPFHMWTPDVYQGSPTPAVGFMAAIAKVGGFAAFLRVFITTLPTLSSSWKPTIWAIATITLLLGAIVALVQRDIKRMLAYSSINHAGFILLGLQAGTIKGVSGSLYYLFAYSFLVLGSFMAIQAIAGRGDEAHDLGTYRGLATKSPALATFFAIFLLAQAGAPFTTGFFAKFYVVSAAVQEHSYALAVIAMTSAAIAAFFYLRVVFLMFGDQRSPAPVTSTAPVAAADGQLEDIAPSEAMLTSAGGAGLSVATLERTATRPRHLGAVDVSPWLWSGLGLTMLATVVFGVWPQPLIDFARQATTLFH
jgi:NADH-quinone oxidoreductase subunit N